MLQAVHGFHQSDASPPDRVNVREAEFRLMQQPAELLTCTPAMHATNNYCQRSSGTQAHAWQLQWAKHERAHSVQRD
jgi:hypothetical protein